MNRTICAVALVSLLGCAATPTHRDLVAPLAHGQLSQIVAAERVVVRDADAWALLWARHTRSTTPRPSVDLSTHMVIGVFMGRRPTGGYSIQVTGAHLDGDALVIQVRNSAPDPDALTSQLLTAPFDLVTVPTHVGPVRFEESP